MLDVGMKQKLRTHHISWEHQELRKQNH